MSYVVVFCSVMCFGLVLSLYFASICTVNRHIVAIERHFLIFSLENYCPKVELSITSRESVDSLEELVESSK